MAAVTIRKLPDDVLRALKVRAAKHGRSTEAEIREILQQAVAPPQKGLGTALYELGQKFGGVELKIERDRRPWRGVTFE